MRSMEGHRLRRLIWVVGPGLMVMLADTDAGSVVTAAQSGARWGFRLLLLQVLLVPVLYLVMELTLRLGITTGKGHAALIRERFGPGWAYVSVAALLVSVVGALVTEFAGIAGAGELYGIPPAFTVTLAAVLLVGLVVSGGYRRVEVVGITLGLLELSFVAAALFARPSSHELAHGLTGSQPLGNRAYLGLVAANVGAVIMPWMLFYQQGAVVDKGLRERHLRIARIDAAVGAVLTQLVMAAVLVTTAVSLDGRAGTRSLRSIGEISTALTPLLGGTASRATLALGMVGAAFVAGIVVSLAAAWAVAETAGRPGSLNARVRKAPLFYAIFVGAVGAGAGAVLASRSLVHLAVDVEIVNALLLPLVLGMLVLLARTALPRAHRLGRPRQATVAFVTGGAVLLGIVWLGFAFGL
jgi:Mn2+/Fe2+ NRAMP family transporter